MIRSLRWRILIGTSIASGVVLAAVGVVLYSSMRHALIGEFDASCLVQARALAAMTEVKHHRMRFDSDGTMPQFAAQQKAQYFELWSGSGPAFAKSQSLGNADLSIIPPTNGPSERPAFESLSLPDGRRGRGVAMRFTPQPDNDDEADNAPTVTAPQNAVVIFAKGTEALDATLARLQRLLISVFGIAIVVSGTVLSAVVVRAMRPLKQLAGDIDAIRPDDLSLRVSPEFVPTELRPVVDRLNELLARLEYAFTREKAFAADVAHELRTPIAGLHTTLEVCRSRPRTAAEYESAIDRCLQMSDGMGSMIRTLLLMARADSGQLVSERSVVEFGELLEGCWTSFASRAAAKSVTLEWNIESGTIEVDLEKLTMVVNNLLDNAVSYVDNGGTIRIGAHSAGGALQISITNSGSTISADQVPLLTQRFWRGDSARSATGLHCGLGLSLCDRLAKAMGGCLRLSLSNGAFAAVVRLEGCSVRAVARSVSGSEFRL